ncbi:hypothetical protein L914_07795 [Phytophthora nicotianae]|uniref:Uncharacterized protein n=2 Tax=Phytophthora nicotianae TaxID=4792 RepID=V9FBM6_PHYNI|nr:hypothetical protein F443_08081 [Phytophthora nicotianae P1569]ETM47498.1 hypothetical protein L914_07795 [Phytophthora nicotianae]
MSPKRDLAEAESCVMVLVEERTAKDQKIEEMTSQQGELELAAQKPESELNTLRSKSSADPEATREMLRGLQESEAHAEEAVKGLQESYSQAEASLQTVQEQLAELRVAALEKKRERL